MLRAALALAATLVFSAAASGVLIDGSNGLANVAPFAVPVLDNIGVRGGLSAIYLGNGVVLTANHVGAGDVTFGDTVYSYVPGSAVRLVNNDGSYPDLLMFEIYPWPDLPALEIPAISPIYGSQLLVAGNGLDRGNPLVWDPNGSYSPGPTGGYAWSSSSHVRWGLNNLEVYPAGGLVFNTRAFGSYFDAGKPLTEAQAVVGDSGGGVFTLSLLGEWQLAGVILGIVQYSGQPAGSSFFGQRTYYADLAYYRPQLENAVELPEPDRMLAPGAVLLGLLGARRRRSAASAGVPAPATR
jgi:hypothetical protein